jgi:aspartyl-tRNA(Asn)/glutamyl-tRNA(Gln) amidotransferase subunit A
MSSELCFLTVQRAAALIASRALSPVELVEAHLRRIDALEPVLRSYITVAADQALARAREAEAELARGRSRGALHGIPYALKDIFLTKGVRTTAASKVLLDHVPADSAHVHTRLEAEGAILLGKLNTFEYGTGVGAPSSDLPFPPARNPWNTRCFTGSTSTGAGAAVAAGTTMAALGTDTGGSVRLPAAACGVVGVKPTFGLLSRRNIIPNAFSLDHVGVVARTVHDAALLLQATAGFDPDDATSVDRPVPDCVSGLGSGVRGLRIGVIRRFHQRDARATPAVAAAIEAAVDVLRRLGAEIVDDEPAASLLDYRACMKIINNAECFAAHRTLFKERYHDLGVGFREKLLGGVTVKAADYFDALRWKARLAAELTQVVGRYDAVICAGTMTAAPDLDDRRAVVDFTGQSAMAAFNLSGQPALSLCTGFDDTGMPLGMQIAAPHFCEPMLLRVAATYEGATAWHTRHPSL